MPDDDGRAGRTLDAPSQDDARRRPSRILLADDDEINRAIVSHLIASLPDAVLTEAVDGREALGLAFSQRFDLIILDLNMPEIRGDRLIRHLRASQSLNADTPMVLFSAAVDAFGRIPDNRAEGLADLILPKPIRAEVFLAAARQLTSRSS